MHQTARGPLPEAMQAVHLIRLEGNTGQYPEVVAGTEAGAVRQLIFIQQ